MTSRALLPFLAKIVSNSGDRRLGAAQQPHAPSVRVLPQHRRLRLQLLPQPDAARHLTDPQRLLEEAIPAKALDRLEIALAQRQQPDIALHQIRQADLAALRQPQVQPVQLGQHHTVTNQHQSSGRGQMTVRFLQMKTGHHTVG